MSSYLTSVLIFTGINLIAVLGMFLLMGLTDCFPWPGRLYGH